MDRHTKEQRRRNMQAIRSRNTKPEMIVRKFLHAAGFRYRLHDKRLPGHPDIVLPKYHCVVFVHGCFWHGHECETFRWPQSNADFWRRKIEDNRLRDERQQDALRADGWRVIVIWECELRPGVRECTLADLEAAIRQDKEET